MDTGTPPQDAAPTPAQSEAVALQRLLNELSPLSDPSRLRLIQTICTFFQIQLPGARPAEEPDQPPIEATRTPSSSPTPRPFKFSEAETPTVKRFLLEKAPTTDVERVACLAYYLAHYRDTPHFKTIDITKLNTEAASRRFSNTAFAVENATKTGYLVPSVKGSKQLSASGEQFVEALPDRQAARGAMEQGRPRRSGRPSARD